MYIIYIIIFKDNPLTYSLQNCILYSVSKGINSECCFQKRAFFVLILDLYLECT